MWCTHHEVQGMLPNRSSENLEVKTMSYLIKPVLFSEHLSISISCKRLGHIVLVEVTVISHIGLLIALLNGIQELLFLRSIPVTSDNDTTLVQLR